jgi:hypothetical protein
VLITPGFFVNINSPQTGWPEKYVMAVLPLVGTMDAIFFLSIWGFGIIDLGLLDPAIHVHLGCDTVLVQTCSIWYTIYFTNASIYSSYTRCTILRHIFCRDRIPRFDIPQYLSLESITQGVAIKQIKYSPSGSHSDFVWIFIFTRWEIFKIIFITITNTNFWFYYVSEAQHQHILSKTIFRSCCCTPPVLSQFLRTKSIIDQIMVNSKNSSWKTTVENWSKHRSLFLFLFLKHKLEAQIFHCLLLCTMNLPCTLWQHILIHPGLTYTFFSATSSGGIPKHWQTIGIIAFQPPWACIILAKDIISISNHVNIARNASISKCHSCWYPYLLTKICVIAEISLITYSSHCSRFLTLAHHLFLLKSHLFLPHAATLLHAFERVVSVVSKRSSDEAR